MEATRGPAERLKLQGGACAACAYESGGAMQALRMEPPAFGLSYETSIVCRPGERHAVVARSDGHPQGLRWTASAQ